jgi:asparagine synthase (glutamine-hydrolysing)
MSGVCGIVHLDGAPVERRLLQAMTAFMSFRGPDAQDVWLDGPAGLGHTLLRTTFEAEHERQPFSLDGEVWITADARIDARSAREGKTTDAELILRAYRAWGEDCVQHLIGDFAFAIWDGPRQRLFCARDHFGVKPFFYARLGPRLVFSNTLNCVRRHPAVAGTLNDLAIADFLLFDMNQDPASTAFAAIQRLPPGHSLTWSKAGLEVRSYWTLPAQEGVRYRRGGDYVEHFRSLLESAVADRLRTDRIGVELSGGLDSTSVAATARAQLARQSSRFEINAHTIVYDRLIEDEERRYAGLAAARLGIPIHYVVADDYRMFERLDHPETHGPEPANEPSAAVSADALQASAARSRVMLTGLDGDALLSESPKPYFRALWNQGQMGRLLAGMVRYGVSQRRLIPLSLREWLHPPRHDGDRPGAFPAWINPDLEARLDLRARWHQVHAMPPEAAHPIRPYAFRVFAYMRRLSNFFEYCDAGVTRIPLEFRHPLMDLRLVNYCLSLPPLPWCVQKKILRDAMRGALPDAILRRPKTPLAGHPEIEELRQPRSQWIDHFVPAPQLGNYVDRAGIPAVCRETDVERLWVNLRPLSLDFWLRSLQHTIA